MRLPSQHYRTDLSATSMTSMIDVVFLLLIFFVCAAAGVVQEQVLATDLAAFGGVASIQQPPEKESWELEIRLRLERGEGNQPVVDMNGTPHTDLNALEQQLRALAGIDASNPVILDVGPQVEWGSVIDLYDRCRRAGLQQVDFAIDAAALD